MSPKNGIFERGIFRVESWELRVERQIRLTKLCYFVTLLPMEILKFVIKTKRYLLAIYSVSTRYLPYFSWETFYPKIIKNGNYIRVDTDFILKTIIVNSDINFRQFKEDFVFALMKCSYAAFGEQNKTDNDSKCQQVYKSLKNYRKLDLKLRMCIFVYFRSMQTILLVRTDLQQWTHSVR